MAEASLSTEYLCDFVYLDKSKIALYAAQLSEDGGLPSLLKRTQKDSGSDKQSIVAGVPKLLTGESTGTTQYETTFEGHFDPAWLLPIEVMSRLHELQYVATDLADARIGGLALLKCRLRIIDIRILRDLWPTIGEMMTHEALAALPANTNPKEKQRHLASKKKENEFMAATIGKMPHSLQAVFYTDEDCLWTTLAPEHMLISADDFAFKHGADVAGEWQVLGVVDALPDTEGSRGLDPVNSLETGMVNILNSLREMMGRPSTAYGITPIAVFRTLKPEL